MSDKWNTISVVAVGSGRYSVRRCDGNQEWDRYRKRWTLPGCGTRYFGFDAAAFAATMLSPTGDYK